jgi:hypothetical protein
MRFALAVVSVLALVGTLSQAAHAGIASAAVTSPAVPGDALAVSTSASSKDLSQPLFQSFNPSNGFTFDYSLSLREMNEPQTVTVPQVTRTELIRERRTTQDIPAVEPIPSPSAMASGFVALAALAAVRGMRRFKLI